MNTSSGTTSFRRRSLSRRIAVGVVSVGAASVLFGAPAADAAPQPHRQGPAHSAPSPQTKVPGTSCTLVQVERAIAHEDPALWRKISSNPKRKKHFERMITMTKEQRQAKRAQWRKNHPNMMGHHKMRKLDPAKKQELRALRAKVIATCGRY